MAGRARRYLVTFVVELKAGVLSRRSQQARTEVEDIVARIWDGGKEGEEARREMIEDSYDFHAEPL